MPCRPVPHLAWAASKPVPSSVTVNSSWLPGHERAVIAREAAGLAYLLEDRVGDLRQRLAALREVTAGGSVIDPQVVDALVARRASEGTPVVLIATPGGVLLVSREQLKSLVREELAGLDLVAELLADRRRQAAAEDAA